VLAFHLMTALAVSHRHVPYVMILLTLVFFPESFTGKPLTPRGVGSGKPAEAVPAPIRGVATGWPARLLVGILAGALCGAGCAPVPLPDVPGPTLLDRSRATAFSWRVMLMEKAGTVFFYVTDPATGREGEVTNRDFLTPNQEKMMATQPDMILQFAHFLADHYRRQGITNPKNHRRELRHAERQREPPLPGPHRGSDQRTGRASPPNDGFYLFSASQ
jgi:hypothetical protein